MIRVLHCLVNSRDAWLFRAILKEVKEELMTVFGISVTIIYISFEVCFFNSATSDLCLQNLRKWINAELDNCFVPIGRTG